VLEAQRSHHAAQAERAQQRQHQQQTPEIGRDFRLPQRAVGVPVGHLAQLDADVGHDAGHVGGADLDMRDLGDDSVLQPHHEAQQHHGQRNEEGVDPGQACAEDAEHQQKDRLEQQGQREAAVQAAAPDVVDQDRGAGRAEQEAEQRAERGQHQVGVAQHQVVGRAGDDAGHVRGVFAHRQEASGIDGAGNESQRHAQVPVGAGSAFMSCQAARVTDRHGGWLSGENRWSVGD